jgi:cytochrome P450 family 110
MAPSTPYAAIPGPADSASEQVRRWIETPIEFWETSAREYGHVVALNLGSLGPVLLVSEPALVRQIFQLPADAFDSRHYNEHYRYVMGDHGVLLQDGAAHARHRSVLVPLFRGDALQREARVIRQSLASAVAQWPVDTLFRPRPLLHATTFRVIVTLLFGTTDSPVARMLIEAHMRAGAQQTGSWGPWRSFARVHASLRPMLRAEIAARRRDPATPGALTRMATEDAGHGPLETVECEDNVLSLLVAGVDTTAVSLAWALYWLCREPAIADRLRAELGDPGDRTGDDLLALPYLHAVFCETLRMYPVVPTPSGRRLLRDVRLGVHDVPAGTTVVACTHLVHRRADLYPEPDRFLPDRFLGRRYGRHEYFPFGGGVRSCVGAALAQLEFKIALAAILDRWSIGAPDGAPARPVRHGTLLAPPDDFTLRAIPRAAHAGAADA